MKIAIVSLYTEEIEDMVIYTSSNQKKYADLHGYDYILFKGRMSNRFPAWDKIKAVEKVLPNYDYVLWMDSDCVFKNLEFKLEEIIDGKHKGFFGKDPMDSIYVNTGVFLLKNDKWSYDLLKYTWGKTGKVYDKVDKFSYQDWPFEQGPMCDFLKNDSGNHHIVPNYKINCHPSFVSDVTYIIHYMGCRTNSQTYVETLSKIKSLNHQNGIESKTQNSIIVNFEEDKNSEIVFHKILDVNYSDIIAKLNFVIRKNNTICFNYKLPDNKQLSHIFKIDDHKVNFNSDPSNCFEVPNEFDLYHSYEWYGETDFKYIGHFKIND